MPNQGIEIQFDAADTPLLIGLVGLVTWSLAERSFHLLRLRQPKSQARERLSWYLCNGFGFGVIVFSLLDATGLRWTTFGPGLSLVRYAGVPFVVIGIIIRILARLTLGQQFSGYVQTTENHRLVTSGIYRLIRHPAYLGYLCLLIGFPLCFGSVGGLVCCVAAASPALLFRMRTEENSLHQWFGEEYEQYVERTSRLLPWIW